MITTKDQERKALEQIRAIVEGLGEGSYLAAAFDGCFSLAEDNIENDWTFSLTQRIEKLQNDMTVMNDDNQELLEKNHFLSHALEDAEKKILGADDLRKIGGLCDSSIAEFETRMGTQAALIVEYADVPEGKPFKDAVSEHRSCKKNANELRKVRENVWNVLQAVKDCD